MLSAIPNRKVRVGAFYLQSVLAGPDRRFRILVTGTRE